MTKEPVSKRALLGALPLAGMAVATGRRAFAQARREPSANASKAGTARATSDNTPKPRLVALEEHFMFPEFIDYFADSKQNILLDLYTRSIPIMSDFGEGRLKIMDESGVDFVVLSLAGPGVQIEPDIAKATSLAKQCNDSLAKEVQKRPDRYGGFAHLALQDPKTAADELERCVRQLGFKGALINGETNGVYLDDRRYDVFWERVEALGMPIYLHPANPPAKASMYSDHPEMWGPVWSWAVETCSHAMRLAFNGTFDRYPGARLILGHMGETLPIQLWRLDSRMTISNTTYKLNKKPSEYIRDNIRITTAGVCSDAALRCSLDALGSGNVMFSIDYPFEDTNVASSWIMGAALSEAERAQVCSGNAAKILKL